MKAALDGPETWVHVAMAKQHKGTDPAGLARVSPFTLHSLCWYLWCDLEEEDFWLALVEKCLLAVL